ncbi:hypothetical protein TNCV_1069131 [Trichonephila clavipes]|nr:hypothetical protein TNCV_1069131 [Trichonephila clavipes]
MTFSQHLWPYIGNNTENVIFQMVKLLVAYPHRPMTLHSPTENSLAVLNHKILRPIHRSKKRVFQQIDCGTSCVTCCAVLLEPQLLDIMIVQFRN